MVGPVEAVMAVLVRAMGDACARMAAESKFLL